MGVTGLGYYPLLGLLRASVLIPFTRCDKTTRQFELTLRKLG
jgi:hypothetical protein